jgi:hypothetical protein
MGLDMYAYTIANKPASEVDFELANDPTPMHYWRKHPDLHGWMERLYRTKGGRAEFFNCVNLLLNEADLDALESDRRAGNLPQTFGFFFGESDGSELDDDLQFITEARSALATNLSVVYSSWW